MPKATAGPALMRAKTSFWTSVDGTDVLIEPGDLADADSAIVRTHPEFFEIASVRFPATAPRVEQATAAPGEKRGA